MTRTNPAYHETSVSSDAVQGEDVKRVLGEVDESKLIEILALKPTLAEVEAAAFWARGDGDIAARAGYPQAGVIARIVEILTADEEEEPG